MALSGGKGTGPKEPLAKDIREMITHPDFPLHVFVRVFTDDLGQLLGPGRSKHNFRMRYRLPKARLSFSPIGLATAFFLSRGRMPRQNITQCQIPRPGLEGKRTFLITGNLPVVESQGLQNYKDWKKHSSSKGQDMMQ